MAGVFATESGGLFLDDAADHDDTEIFHLWNRANMEQRPLLLVSGQPVAQWGITLPDLQSRLAASLHLAIGAPDEAMIDGLLQKYFSLRGLTISEDALRYLEKRMVRSVGYFRIQFCHGAAAGAENGCACDRVQKAGQSRDCQGGAGPF